MSVPAQLDCEGCEYEVLTAKAATDPFWQRIKVQLALTGAVASVCSWPWHGAQLLRGERHEWGGEYPTAKQKVFFSRRRC